MDEVLNNIPISNHNLHLLWLNILISVTVKDSISAAFIFPFILRWGETESTCYVGHYSAYSISPSDDDDDDDECAAIGGIRTGRRTLSSLRNPTPAPLCPPQISHLTWHWSRAAAVGSRQLATRSMRRSCLLQLPKRSFPIIDDLLNLMPSKRHISTLNKG
jgi:hypothetical protein